MAGDAARLLAEARALYDDPRLPFAQSAMHAAWRRGFASAAEWMRLVLSHLRGAPLASVSASFQGLGLIKYGACSLGALLFLLAVAAARTWPLAVGAVVVFYAIEAQLVFLFPLALDDRPDPLRESRRFTVRAGGTLAVMSTVVPLAAVMLFGGLAGRGFVRCWCLGCLAVVLWYEEVRRAGV